MTWVAPRAAPWRTSSYTSGNRNTSTTFPTLFARVQGLGLRVRGWGAGIMLGVEGRGLGLKVCLVLRF